MDDGEFWAHVLQPGEGPDDYDPDEDDGAPPPPFLSQPCPECGEVGACAYDEVGRPLIHAYDREDA
jgi:hypothetical protein